MKQCKPKKCRECKTVFQPRNSLQSVCSPGCAIQRVQRTNEQKARVSINKERKSQRKAHRARKQALKSKSDWLREAQTAFNAYIRERDKNENCISCENPPRKRNAGHYLSVGAHPELRFHPFNNNLQCEHCNTYKSGNQALYRQALVRKVGADNVEWLEGPHQAQNLTIDDIKEIKEYYLSLIHI